MSAKIQHLENAPIKEALIDIQVVLPDNTILSDINELSNDLQEYYPHIGKRFEATFKIKGEQPELPDQKQIGIVFSSEDKKEVVQARLDGITYSRLEPYETWERLRDEALRLWAIYNDHLHPTSITRVACRYINEMKFSLPMTLSEYITAPPPKIEGLPDNLKGFLTRVNVQLDDTPTNAVFTQAIKGITSDKTVTIIIDIDVYRERTFQIVGDELPNALEEFHDYKNKIFFSSITENAVEYFK